MALYFHLARGLMHSSFRSSSVWCSGVIVYLLFCAVAFLGYVLPWGQISLWGATVICSLLSVLPRIGPSLVTWVWGAHVPSGVTICFFFSVHVLLPVVTLLFVICHLSALHVSGSSSVIGTYSFGLHVCFSPLYIVKDILSLIWLLTILFILLSFPHTFSDASNFIAADYSISPAAILPEWYFLHLYAVLRSVPNKLGGVILFILAVSCLLWCITCSCILSSSSSLLSLYCCTLLLSGRVLLGIIGSCHVVSPFVFCGQLLSLFYFLIWMLLIVFNWLTIYLLLFSGRRKSSYSSIPSTL